MPDALDYSVYHGVLANPDGAFGHPATSAPTIDADTMAAPSGTSVADSDFTITRGYLRLTDQRGTANAPEIHLTGYNGGGGFGIDVANSPLSRDIVFLFKENAYYINDAATTSGSAVVTSAAEGNFASAYVGAAVTGSGIPNGTTIASVDSATQITLSANATATATGVRLYINKAGVGDIGYMRHRGGKTPTVGFGVSPPSDGYRLQVAGQALEPEMGALRLLGVASQTGHMLAFVDSGNTDRLWVDKDFIMRGANNTYGSSLVLQGDATNDRSVSMIDKTKTSHWAWQWTGATYLSLRDANNARNLITVDSSGNIQLGASGKGMGFYGAATATKQAVTGSRGGNAALASLLTALAATGLITDSSSA